MTTPQRVLTGSRVPGFLFTALYDALNRAEQLNRLLVIAQVLPTGEAPVGVPVRCNQNEAETFCGRGSQAHLMLDKVFEQRPNLDVWMIGLADPSSGTQKATGSQTATGPMTSAGVFVIDAAGKDILVNADLGDTPEQVAAKLVAGLGRHTDLPFAAEVDGTTASKINYTARNSGEPGNDIKIAISFKGGDPGLTFDEPAITLSGGAGNPDIGDALSMMGDDWFRWIIMPYTDSANLALLEAELDDRVGALRAIGSRAFLGFSGTHGQCLAFGDSRNSEHVATFGVTKASHPAWLWAAAMGAAAADSLAQNSSRKLNGVAVRGLKPPKPVDRWLYAQNNQALFDGISTYDVGKGDVIFLQRVITMRQVDENGFDDNSRLDITKLEQYEDYRYEQMQHMAQYANALLAEDSPDLPNNTAIMTPNKFEAILKTWYVNTQVRQLGRCHKPEEYAPEAVIDGDSILFTDNPFFVNGLVQIHGTAHVQS